MEFNSTYASLDLDHKGRALAWMRKTFSPILTGWEPVEGGGRALVQLQLIDRKAHALLHHRLDFCSFSSDRRVLDRHLVLHRVHFIREGSGQKEQIGDYVELSLDFEDLWKIGGHLTVPRADLQILLVEEGVRKVLDVDALKPFLPERLKKVNLLAISQKVPDPPVKQADFSAEDPIGGGGRLNFLG